ncbi:MAG: hypothetical protein QNK03_28155, partial [Myxococcota bacterium]|nr:hypothetical protein [Myxococcota bacterium]
MTKKSANPCGAGGDAAAAYRGGIVMMSRPLRSIAVRSTARWVLWLAVAGLGLCPAGSVAFAEPTNPHPLRPADTSSPRDTLKSFLADVEQFADEWRRGDVTTDGFRALVRAI